MPNPPRLRTLANHPGPEVEVNGVLIPADQWTFSHGLYSTAPVEVDVRFFAEFVPDEPEQPNVDCCPAPADACSECPPSPPLPRVGETVHYVDYSLPLPGQVNDPVCLPALVVRPPATAKFEDGTEYEDDSTTLAVFSPRHNDGLIYPDARHESHPDNTGRFMTWHYADACQATEDAPTPSRCAVAPDTNACAPEPAPPIRLLLSAPGDALVPDVDALIRKLAKKADAAGLHLTLG